MPYLGEKIEQVKGEQRSGKDCAFSGLKHLNIITKCRGWSGQVLGSIPALAKKKNQSRRERRLFHLYYSEANKLKKTKALPIFPG
jgi:hypothetical protein